MGSYDPGTSFLWSPTAETTQVINAVVAGTYTLTITDPYGCENASSIQVDQVQIPQMSLQPVDSTSCSNEDVALVASVQPDNGNFQWTILQGNGTILPSDTDTIAAYSIAASDTAVVIEASYTNRCKDTVDVLRFGTVEPPVAGITADRNLINVGESITYDNDPIQVGLDIRWVFELGGGLTDQIEGEGPIEQTYDQEGFYTTDFIVVDTSTQCSDTASLNVEVQYNQIIFVPNVFSPEARNLDNKTWKVFGQNIAPDGFELKVYNRWGGLVYESNDLTESMQNGWDGTDMGSGEILELGVYTYTLKAQFEDGTPIEKVGTVTMIK
jgi:hypothetical protein